MSEYPDDPQEDYEASGDQSESDNDNLEDHRQSFINRPNASFEPHEPNASFEPHEPNASFEPHEPNASFEPVGGYHPYDGPSISQEPDEYIHDREERIREQRAHGEFKEIEDNAHELFSPEVEEGVRTISEARARSSETIEGVD
jgi:hypothetical protein